MAISDQASALRRGLEAALARFDEGEPQRQAKRQKSTRLDLGLFLALLFALAPGVLELSLASRDWGSADWILCLHLVMLLFFAAALQLRVCSLNRGDGKDVPALIELIGDADRLCAEFRRAARRERRSLSPGEKRALDRLAHALRRAESGREEALHLVSLRGPLIRFALLLLGLCWASFLLPLHAEGRVWSAGNWIFALLMTAVAVLFLLGEGLFLVSAHKTRLLRKHLGRCRLEIRCAAEELRQEDFPAPEKDE